VRCDIFLGIIRLQGENRDRDVLTVISFTKRYPADSITNPGAGKHNRLNDITLNQSAFL
jgi:hypothetical protein